MATSKQLEAARRAQNPQTLHENRFFSELSEILGVEISRQYPIQIRRRVDGFIKAKGRELFLLNALGLDTRLLDIFIEHYSRSITVRDLRRLRNLMQEQSTSNQMRAGVIFLRHNPKRLIAKGLLVQGLMPGHFRFSPGLNDDSTLELIAVVPRLLPEGEAFDHLRLAMAQTEEEFRSLFKRRFGLESSPTVITFQEIRDMNAEAVAELADNETQDEFGARWARSVAHFLRMARKGDPWYAPLVPVLEEFDARAKEEQQQAMEEQQQAMEEQQQAMEEQQQASLQSLRNMILKISDVNRVTLSDSDIVRVGAEQSQELLEKWLLAVAQGRDETLLLPEME